MIKQTGYKIILIGLTALYLNGCSLFISNATEDFGSSLSQLILDHDDPETVAEAIPAYLLLLETLVANDPENEALLSSTAILYSSYIGLLEEDSNRKKHLADRALFYALRSACSHSEKFCLINKLQYGPFEDVIKDTDIDDIGALYSLGSIWASWIQANKSDWNAIAQLAQVKLIMTRVVELDDGYKDGSAHVYLGVLATILSPALGGTPEIGKQHFERALMLSEEKNLMVKVVYARQYARMMFDRELHDMLLNSVMTSDIQQPGLTLMNTLAQKQAKELLESADEYF